MKHILIALTLFLSTACAHIRPSVHPSTITVIDKSLDSVGHIQGLVTDRGHEVGYGCTAFSIADRRFLTAAHCIGKNMQIDGHPAFAISADESLDLAVIVADYVKPALHIRVSPLTRGEEVTGLGYGYSWKYPTITHHIVMILDFSPWNNVVPGTVFAGVFIGGQSGGPVIDAAGLVVGIVQQGDSIVGYGVNTKTILSFLATVGSGQSIQHNDDSK